MYGSMQNLHNHRSHSAFKRLNEGKNLWQYDLKARQPHCHCGFGNAFSYDVGNEGAMQKSNSGVKLKAGSEWD
ncbi:hypothetical protein SOASR030_20990 [Leminorella grimontii]|uniref:Uncharacterized protein n=1 Tax=Leminorella grimontii TaxID=82981 RepID=A0AAV5N2J8_9GAMM|nr:hypothetical protein SOASR030_20990 [Leminorella grimontii]GKX59033.1 hypothetical protein SOASR031_13480 [Leminorella grimontii]